MCVWKIRHYIYQTPHHWIYIYIYIYHWSIGIKVKVFANGQGDWGSIPGRVIPKTQKMLLDVSLLNTQYYKIRVKGKWNNPRKGVTPSLRCSSYWKGNFRVAPTTFGQLIYTYIYIYILKGIGLQWFGIYVFVFFYILLRYTHFRHVHHLQGFVT